MPCAKISKINYCINCVIEFYLKQSFIQDAVNENCRSVNSNRVAAA